MLLHTLHETVSTHSRPKAAASFIYNIPCRAWVSTHSRPKAAVVAWFKYLASLVVSTHSRPKAAGYHPRLHCANMRFQHTAARRRLMYQWSCLFSKKSFNTQPPEGGCCEISASVIALRVSTHSRPKAAGKSAGWSSRLSCFNTQPPEGG